MPQTIIDARKQYLMLSQSDNTELISAINGENAILMTQVYSQKRDLSLKSYQLTIKLPN